MTTDFRTLCADLADSTELLLEMRHVDAKHLRIAKERLKHARTVLSKPSAASFRPTSLTPAALEEWNKADAAIEASIDRVREIVSTPAPQLAAKYLHALSEPFSERLLTDEELLQIAADVIDPHEKIDLDEFEDKTGVAAHAYGSELIAFARAAIAADRARRPAPEPPTEGEVGELLAALRQAAQSLTPHHSIIPLEAVRFTRAAELLERQHPQPVPVSERLPGPEDCLDEGWAWFFNPRTGWRQATQPVHTGYTHWLPAHALPLPSGEVAS